MIKLNLNHSVKIMQLLVVLTLIFLPSISQATDIQVKIDRSSIQLNETFTLIFESNDDVDDDPDFSPLEQNFKILGQRTGSNISLINGKYTKSQRWNISLMALKEGTLTIPSISFGSDKSPEYQITIKPVQQSSGKAGEEFISELELSTSTAYPQSQIIITQRMLSSRNINGYEFSKLSFSGIEIAQEQLGELKQYQTKRGDTPYLVLEQAFVIYPQSTGTLTINPSIASARVAINNNSQFNSFRSNTKTVRQASSKKIITVKPVPSNFKGRHWLPAKEVQLVEHFPQSTDFKVGEPITRTLSLFVDGQIASQLPEFIIDEIKNLKQYPDKPVLNNTVTDDGITGGQQIKVAIIPSKEGNYTLPEVSIAWWNTSSNKQEVATIPARSFAVGKAPISTSPNTQTNQSELSPELPTLDISEPPVVALPEKPMPSDSTGSIWVLISFILATGWAVTLYFLWKSKQALHKSENYSNPVNISESKALKMLHKSCDTSDAQLSKEALLAWAKSVFPKQSINSLGDIISLVPSPLAEKISALNTHLYTQSSDTWSCDNLPGLCNDFSSKHKAKNQDNLNKDNLESLYQ